MKKINHFVLHNDTPAINGMIKTVDYLVEGRGCKSWSFKFNTKSRFVRRKKELVEVMPQAMEERQEKDIMVIGLDLVVDQITL